MRSNTILMATVLFFAMAASIGAQAAEPRHFSFAYDQPHTTAYGIAADTFANKLQELSNGTMIIDQFPGAQLGQEPQVLQKLRTGDIDFAITSTANSATVQPEVRGIFDPFRVSLGGPSEKGPRRPGGGGGLYGDDEFKGPRRPHPGARDDGLPGYLQQTRDPSAGRSEKRQGAGPGDGDRRHDVPGLWCANRPHAVRRCLHVTADRRRRGGGKRHQRLPDEQALRGRADHVADRARGEQQCHLGQRQGVEQPQ